MNNYFILRQETLFGHFLLVLFLFGAPLLGCKKAEIKESVKKNGLNNTWHLDAKIDNRTFPITFYDSALLVTCGYYCCLKISESGDIDVFSDYNQNSKIAVWRICEINGSIDTTYNLNILVKMIEPEKSKQNRASYYIIKKISNDKTFYIFAPIYESNKEFIFFTNKRSWDYNCEYYFYAN